MSKMRVSVDINSDELEDEVKNILQTKLYHIAKGNVEKLVKDSQEKEIKKRIEEAIEDNTDKADIKRWVKDTVESWARKEAHSALYGEPIWGDSELLRKYIDEALKDALAEECKKNDLGARIKGYVNEYVKSETLKECQKALNETLANFGKGE